MLLSLAQLLLTCLYFFRQSLHKAKQHSDRTTASFFFSYTAAPILRCPAVYVRTLMRPVARDMLTLLQLGLTRMSTCNGIGSIKHEVVGDRRVKLSPGECMLVTRILCRCDKHDAEACMKELMADVRHWDHSFTTPLQAHTTAHKNSIC